MRMFFVLLLSLTGFAEAREGFSTDFAAAPAAVRAWEERTFMVTSGGSPIGTAFLVHRDSAGLHFLTASHVALRCHGESQCSLNQNASWRRIGSGYEFTAKVSLLVPEKTIHFFKPTGKSWERVGEPATDLAYFRTEGFEGSPSASDSELGPFSLPTIPVYESLDVPHYILGYPGLMQRPSLRPQEEYRTVRLRWSEGEKLLKERIISPGFMDPAMITRRHRLYSNADSFAGNSGGPAVDANGKLVGVLIGGPNYDEYKHEPDKYSYIVPADYARVFLRAVLIGHAAAERMCVRTGHRDRAYCKSE